MFGGAGSPPEVKSVVATKMDNFNKKRKLRDELSEIPRPKHVCWDQTPADCDSSSDSSTDPNQVDSTDKCTSEGGESEASNCSNCGIDSIMSTDDEAKTNPGYQETHTSDDPSTSSLSWGGTSSSAVNFYSSDIQSMARSGPSETETGSESISKQPGCPYHQCALLEGHVHEYDCIGSEYKSDAILNNELDNLLYSNGNYVLSSGRWSVNQGNNQQGGEKLTIDKEFEQYFSMLML